MTAPTRFKPILDTRSGIGYLPGLDGLRAVSIIAVIAYHLDQTWATGGYLGVEVFFVVSGYLITLLALDEHRRLGFMDRLAFWGRRARRLLPAVVVLVVAVLAYTALVLGRDELHRFRGDGIASLLYVQNWHSIIAHQPYFAFFGRPSPLRHLWSLAIEEQFYLLWPLVLPFSLRRFGRPATAVLTLLGALGSVAAMTSLADIAAPERAYYGTDTRAFGILFGCALAFAWQPQRFRPDIARAPRRALAVAGTAAIVVLGWQFAHRYEYDPWTYPWGFVVVDLCTVVLIVASTHPGSPLRHRIGSRPLAAIGRRSYSLYLWHWPVIVFTRPGLDWPWRGSVAIAGQLLLTVALAEVSYRWIEQPFRDGRARAQIARVIGGIRTERRSAILVGALTVLVLGIVGALAVVPAPDQTLTAGPAAVTIPLDPPTTTTTTTTPARRPPRRRSRRPRPTHPRRRLHRRPPRPPRRLPPRRRRRPRRCRRRIRT